MFSLKARSNVRVLEGPGFTDVNFHRKYQSGSTPSDVADSYVGADCTYLAGNRMLFNKCVCITQLLHMHNLLNTGTWCQ
jgi:hypothetical protein